MYSVSRLFVMFVISVPYSERLALPTSDHGVAGSNPAGGEILPEPKRRFIAQSLSCSPSHRLEMTEILLKGRKTLTHPSIVPYCFCLITVGSHPISAPKFDPLRSRANGFIMDTKYLKTGRSNSMVIGLA